MTTTTDAPDIAAPSGRPPRRRRLAAAVAAAVVAAGGLGAGLGVAFSGSSSSPASPSASSAGSASSPVPYSYYQSVMGRYGLGAGSMMGGSRYGWMAGATGYGWMMGGAGAPGWMTGGTLPGFMMGASTDPGRVMGSLFADAPGPRVSAAEAARLGARVPAGATVERAANRITFTTTTVDLVVLASPTMPSENFRIAGLTNPTVVVPVGATVTVELINADGDMAHGLAVTSAGAASSWMPMMSAAPVFSGAAVWFLGAATPAGMHQATLTFTASAAGDYRYLCPVPGHAQMGMVGTFTVR